MLASSHSGLRLRGHATLLLLIHLAHARVVIVEI